MREGVLYSPDKRQIMAKFEVVYGIIDKCKQCSAHVWGPTDNWNAHPVPSVDKTCECSGGIGR